MVNLCLAWENIDNKEPLINKTLGAQGQWKEWKKYKIIYKIND